MTVVLTDWLPIQATELFSLLIEKYSFLQSATIYSCAWPWITLHKPWRSSGAPNRTLRNILILSRSLFDNNLCPCNQSDNKNCQLLCNSCLRKVTCFFSKHLRKLSWFLCVWRFSFVSLFFSHLDIKESGQGGERTLHGIRETIILCTPRWREPCLRNEWWSPEPIYLAS